MNEGIHRYLPCVLCFSFKQINQRIDNLRGYSLSRKRSAIDRAFQKEKEREKEKERQRQKEKERERKKEEQRLEKERRFVSLPLEVVSIV